MRKTFQWGLPTLRTTIICSAAGAKVSILSVDQVSTQSSCACTVAPASAASSLDSAGAAAPIRKRSERHAHGAHPRCAPGFGLVLYLLSPLCEFSRL